ncbi:MAG: histidine phosphatase family protein [Anaerolineae bacterium]|nr:histidine phosphatase family protein [Anaerolineae bacterium]
MKLLLARHGQSVWQVEGDSAGLDPALTQLGELQAHRLGAYLRDGGNGMPQTPSIEVPLSPLHIDAIIASDLRRARRTAEIVGEYLDLPVTFDAGFREFEEWEAGWAPLPRSMWDAAPTTPEFAPGYARFRAQVAAATRRTVEVHPPESTLLIVAHRGTIGTQLRWLFGADAFGLWLYNAALTEIEWHDPASAGKWSLRAFNNVEYLPPAMRTV